MDVSLTPELEQFVNQKVRSGTYPSASEVIRDGLRALKERDELDDRRREELRRELRVGIDQADRGEVRPLTGEIIEDVKSRGRERLASRPGRTSA